jgi:hypothetical protein
MRWKAVDRVSGSTLVVDREEKEDPDLCVLEFWELDSEGRF